MGGGPETTAAEWLPERLSMTALRRESSHCKACPLWRGATQTVFGEGLVRSRLMLVGEQPGDEEDRRGRPFVGPSGRLLDEALQEAGIDRRETFVTNVVKHFKWEPRGKRRIHQRPDWDEIQACLPWLEAEVEVVEPEVIVCLGATAAQSLLRRDFRVTRERGSWVESELAPHVTATVHPSSILRVPDRDARRDARRAFVEDLGRVAEVLAA